MQHSFLIGRLGVLLTLIAVVSPQSNGALDEKEGVPETRSVAISISGMTWAVGWIPQVREALEALPWVRKAEISFLKRQAIVVVESGRYKPAKLIEVIKSSGFTGKIVGVESNADKRQIVALIVRGMKKAKSGATWLGWPSEVSESLEGTHARIVSWDLKRDQVTVSFDPRKTRVEQLVKAITGLGYEVEIGARLDSPVRTTEKPVKAPEPKSSKDFLAVFRSARATSKPIVLVFSAAWCAPCIRMKKETLGTKDVRKMLGETCFIEVDLDQHPALAGLYGVDSIPHIVFVDRAGFIQDRVQGFENAARFTTRMKRLLNQESD